jgi:uncharacterized membrane protein YhaH (DUF805 family)
VPGAVSGSTRGSVPGAREATPRAPSTAGRTLFWAVRLILAEAIAVGALTVVSILATFTSSSYSVESAIATSGFIALCAVILAALGVALSRKKALARGPSIVLQLLLIPLGFLMIEGGLVWLGVPVIAIGVLGAGLLLAPSTRTALGLY